MVCKKCGKFYFTEQQHKCNCEKCKKEVKK